MKYIKKILNILFRSSFDRDTYIEKERYDKRAESRLKNKNLKFKQISSIINDTYVNYYFPIIKRYANKKLKILELCAGDGKSSKVILDNFLDIYLTDISINSLNLLKKRYGKNIPASTQFIQSNMEEIPFKDSFFDIVVCAGGLSYGNNLKVMNEIHRILNKNGVFICIDSLDNNLIYKVNRFVHFLKRERTYSTLKRMPNISLINLYRSKFDILSLSFHGSFFWLLAPLSKILNIKEISKISDMIDKRMPSWMAFKFVMEAKKI